MKVYVGSYAPAAQPGLSCLELDVPGHTQRLVHAQAGYLNPSFLTFSNDGRHAYAVNETEERDGFVVGFRVRADGFLQPVSRQCTHGRAPCHVMYLESDGLLVCTNYAGGSLSVHRVLGDARIDAAHQILVHTGSGPHPERQRTAHPHCAVYDPGSGLVLVPDLGCDAIFTYTIEDGRLVRCGRQSVTPGSGPRHLALHPDGITLYLVCELGNTVEVFRREAAALRHLQSIPTLPEGALLPSTAADIHVSPDGRHLYVSNRGHDSLAVYAIGAGGRLAASGYVPCGGRTPRHFTLSADGHFVLVANQNSNTVSVFARNAAEGSLTACGAPFSPGMVRPSCVVIQG